MKTTTTTQQRLDLVSRPETELELLRQVYEDAGLQTEDAQQAACADLTALYASPWRID